MRIGTNERLVAWVLRTAAAGVASCTILSSAAPLLAAEGDPVGNERHILGNSGFSRHGRHNLTCVDGFEAGGWRAAINSGSKGGWAENAPLWFQSMNQGDYSAVAATSPVRAGKYSMRFEWRAEDYRRGSNTSKKAHLLSGKEPTCREERWWGFSLYCPADGTKKDSKPELYAQWHSTPDKGEPPASGGTESPGPIAGQTGGPGGTDGLSAQPRRSAGLRPLRADGLDIGSGRVEAACKHVVGIRMKRSGMRWSSDGAQATLSLAVPGSTVHGRASGPAGHWQPKNHLLS